MNAKSRKIMLTILLLAALGNYARMTGTEDIRTVAFLSIFAIGALSALLIREIFGKDNQEEE
jgi:hypothetical protein